MDDELAFYARQVRDDAPDDVGESVDAEVYALIAAASMHTRGSRLRLDDLLDARQTRLQ